MTDLGITPVFVESLRTRRGQPAAMHIEVPFSVKDRVMESDFWPSGIRVHGWRLRYHHQYYDRPRRNFNWEFDY